VIDNWLVIGLSITTICVSHIAGGAEQLYTHQAPVTPELAFSGTFDVGVTTLTAIDPKRLNTENFISYRARQLILEVWYPASLLDEPEKTGEPATYKNVTRLQKPFELQGDAHRDAPPVARGRFPLIVLSHGFTGYRTQMFYLGEHLASHGYIVVGIDHTGSTNAEIKTQAARAWGD
jgi:predicted dienelactone hydrolase